MKINNKNYFKFKINSFATVADNMPSNITYNLVRNVVRLSAMLGYRLEVEGIDNLFDNMDGLSEGAIFAGNHESVIDAFLMGLIVPSEIPRVFFLGKKSALWRNRYWGRMMDYFGVIPVNQKNNGEAVARGLDILNKKQALGIFPEGHIRYSRKALNGKVGVSRFAFETERPVVPVGIVGTDGVLPYGGNWPSLGTKVSLIVGEPMYLSYDYDKSDIYSYDALRKATDLIMYNIRHLSSGYGINPLDAANLSSMKGVNKMLLPKSKFHLLSLFQNKNQTAITERFSNWMTTLEEDEWSQKQLVKEEKPPSPKSTDNFLDWLDDQL